MIGGSTWKPGVAALAGSVGLIWAVSLYGLFVDPGVVSALALVPRRIDGLPGVLGTLLVHGSLGHLSANTPPLLVLGGMVVVRGVAYYLTTALAITVLGGSALWVFGRSAAHIGASGLVLRPLRIPGCARLLRAPLVLDRRGPRRDRPLRRPHRRRGAARRAGLVGGPPLRLARRHPVCARAPLAVRW